MKVLFVNTLYHPNVIGGAERSVQFLAEELVTSGHEAVVLSVSPKSNGQPLHHHGVKVYYLDFENVYWPWDGTSTTTVLKPIYHAIDTYNPLMAAKVKRILEDERPDVVHTNNLAGFSVAVWFVARQLGIPVVHTLRDYYLLCPKGTAFKGGHNCESQCLGCKVYGTPRRSLSNQVSMVVGISQHILERHLALGYFSQVAQRRVIFNAYRPALEQSTSARTTNVLQLGYIGRLEAPKGIENLLRALDTVQSAGIGCSLLIAGTGKPEFEHYLRTRYPLNNVTYLGFVPPEEFFPKIDLLVVPSLWNEPLGRIVFESYGYGVPVMGAERGGIPELIEEGKTGFLFNPDDIESTAQKLMYCMEHYPAISGMRDRCLQKSKEFLPGLICEQYLDAFKAALPKAR